MERYNLLIIPENIGWYVSWGGTKKKYPQALPVCFWGPVFGTGSRKPQFYPQEVPRRPGQICRLTVCSPGHASHFIRLDRKRPVKRHSQVPVGLSNISL